MIAVPGVDRLRWLHRHHHPAPDRPGPDDRHRAAGPLARTATSSTTRWRSTTARPPGSTWSRARRRRWWRSWTGCGSCCGSSRPTSTADWALLSLVGPSSVDAAGRSASTARPHRSWRRCRGPSSPARTSPPDRPRRYAVAALPAGGFARRMSLRGGPARAARRGGDVGGRALGVPLAGLWAFEALRVAARRPRLGRDTDHRTLPAEVGWLADAVHLDKGCYRGQETVARVHNLGRPPRRLVLLHLDGIATDELPAAGHPGDHRRRADGRLRRHRGPPLRAGPGRPGRGQAQRRRRRRRCWSARPPRPIDRRPDRSVTGHEPIRRPSDRGTHAAA